MIGGFLVKIIKYPNEVDKKVFNSDSALEVKYGLPKDVIFCKKCVISNQRPSSTVEYENTKQSKKTTIGLDSDGVCSACRVNENKHQTIDWALREKELRELCNQYRRTDGRFDCIVPGSGGKDSFYQSHILKYKYNMHPLTVTWAPHIYTEWGWKNFQSWLGAGFDNFLCTPNPRLHRLLTRLSTEILLHPFQPFIVGQKSLAPKLALKYDIPLIFYGECESEYGNAKNKNNDKCMDTDYFVKQDEEHCYLSGVSVSELKGDFGVDGSDLRFYMPADENELNEKDVQVHYLGYYLPWHPQENYYYAVEHGGFIPSPERTPGTYSKYNSIDDRVDDFHYYTTMIKFGIGRATYDAAQEIRNDEITREEGVALVKKFDGEFPERFAEEFFKYISMPSSEYPIASKMFEQPIMDREYFMRLVDSFRSPHLWKWENGEWKLRHTVYGA